MLYTVYRDKLQNNSPTITVAVDVVTEVAVTITIEIGVVVVVAVMVTDVVTYQCQPAIAECGIL